MATFSRRVFLKHVGASAGVAALTLLTKCAPGVPATPGAAPPFTGESTPQPSATPTPLPTPTALPSPTPTSTPQRTVLMSENREGFYIRFINTIEPVDVEAWRLAVGGMVDNSQQLRFADILRLPTASQTSRMKCVEGWSAAAKWTGFRPRVLFDLVMPQPEASWVHFHCEDGYYESLELAELLADRVLFVHGMNDGPLPPEHGAPLRLIVPSKYGYKGPKTINRLTFSNEELRGFWPTMGRYTTDGQILAGVDRALDLGTHRIFDKMGEIFYEEGPESQEM